jgi:hypothetical protein
MIGRISVLRLFSIPTALAALGTIGACLPAPDNITGAAGSSGNPGAGGNSGSAGTGVTSCGGASGTSPLATWANIREIIEVGQPGGCYGSDCHRQGEREPILLASSGQLSDAALYDKLTTYKTVTCGQRVLVKPCAPEESAFYVAQMGTCGDLPQMPFGCLPEFENCTAPDKLEGLRQWIASGAPRP